MSLPVGTTVRYTGLNPKYAGIYALLEVLPDGRYVLGNGGVPWLWNFAPNEFEPVPLEESVCQEADRLVSTDRGKVYGHPLDDFGKVTAAARALGIFPTTCPEHHALYMILVKLARLSTSPGHHDSIVDICGYAKTYDMVLKERKVRTCVGSGAGDRVSVFSPTTSTEDH